MDILQLWCNALEEVPTYLAYFVKLCTRSLKDSMENNKSKFYHNNNNNRNL